MSVGCRICSIELIINVNWREYNKKHGIYLCDDCVPKFKHEQYLKHRERISQKKKEDRKNNPEKYRMYEKKKWERTKERMKIDIEYKKHIYERQKKARKKWETKHPEKRREISRKYYQSHKKEEYERCKRYIVNNREKVRERRRKYYHKIVQIPERKQKLLKWGREGLRRWHNRNPNYKKDKIRGLRSIVLAHYGNKCAVCGETHVEFLTIDHIYGGGNQHRKKVRGGTDGYTWIIKNGFPDDLQILCWNCNFIKAIPKIRNKYNLRIKNEIFSHYSNGFMKCACCGMTGIENLALDHIEKNGASERKRSGTKGGFAFYLWLRKQGFPAGYRVLCHNCNSALGLYGYCPHELRTSIIC